LSFSPFMDFAMQVENQLARRRTSYDRDNAISGIAEDFATEVFRQLSFAMKEAAMAADAQLLQTPGIHEILHREAVAHDAADRLERSAIDRKLENVAGTVAAVIPSRTGPWGGV
jgi:hypothetical protein